jgi:hypothetical protein
MSEATNLHAVKSVIQIIRNQRVILDTDLAKLYGVTTKALNQAIKRNADKFPSDFMFQLTEREVKAMVSHFAIPSKQHLGGHLPYAFTEQGVAMLSTVLRSKRAVQVNIAIMRTFVKLREILSTHKELACKLDELERKVEQHDEHIQSIFGAIRQLMALPAKPRRRIGFTGNG